MKEILEYMTSGFWIFLGCIIIFSMALDFILKIFKVILWTKRELLFENDKLMKNVEKLKEKLENGTKK